MVSKAPQNSSGRHPFYWITLLLGTFVLGLYVVTSVMIFQYGTLKKEWGWSYTYRFGKPLIAEVESGGPADGKLQVGDQIVAINDDTRAGNGQLGIIFLKQRTIPPDSDYTLDLIRGSNKQRVSLHMSVRSDYGVLIYVLPSFIVGLSVYLLALLIGLLKPEQRVTQFLGLAYFSIATFIIKYAMGPIMGFLPETVYRILTPLCSLATPVAIFLLYCFCYYLPTDVKRGRIWIYFGYAIFLWIVIDSVWIAFKYFPLIVGGEQGLIEFNYNFNHPEIVSFYNLVDPIMLLFSGIALCAVRARNFIYLKNPDQRRRMKWAIYGELIGTAPALIYMLANFVLDNTGYHYITKARRFDMAGYVIILSLILCPIALGYAIIKHQILDINVVIRRGLQHLLAKNSLRAILIIQASIVAYTIIRNPNMTIGEILSPKSVHIYLILTTVLGLIYQARLMEWIDRRFFREEYNREKILLELIDEIKRLDSITGISKLVSKRVDEALHLECIYIYYRAPGTGDFKLGHSSNDLLSTNRIMGNSELLSVLEDQETAQYVSSLEQLPKKEREWIDELGIELLVPMRGTDHHLIGLLLLGKKRSEEPYSSGDQRLLEAIAGQIAVLHENILLKESVIKERKIKREVLAKLGDKSINLLKECPSCSTCFDGAMDTCPEDGSELKLTLPVERIIEERYRLERFIGKGAMGAVYESTDLRLNRKVAIKILIGSMFGNQEALRRFEREARSSAKLNHPNIIAVHDYGRLSNEGAYLVMELLNGLSLRSKLRESDTLQTEDAAEIFEQLMEGVKAAHRAGVIHRDLKPENVFITRQESGTMLVKVLDFGLAKSSQIDTADPTSLTNPGVVMGTFGYMPLEQLSGEAVDERADIFSIGVMIAESLTGGRPFHGRTVGELTLALVRGSFRLDGDSEQTRRLETVLQRCLAKDPNDRFSNIEEMQKEIIPAIRDCPEMIATAHLPKKEIPSIDYEQVSTQLVAEKSEGGKPERHKEHKEN